MVFAAGWRWTGEEPSPSVKTESAARAHPDSLPSIHGAAAQYAAYAEQFVNAWAAPTSASDMGSWRRRVGALATEELRAGLAATSVAALPGGRAVQSPQVGYVST